MHNETDTRTDGLLGFPLNDAFLYGVAGRGIGIGYAAYPSETYFGISIVKTGQNNGENKNNLSDKTHSEYRIQHGTEPARLTFDNISLAAITNPPYRSVDSSWVYQQLS